MINHSLRQIEQMEQLFKDRNYPLVNADVGGRKFAYYVLPQLLNNDLPDFIYRVTNNETRRYVMGVSESVPAELQPYFALAEYIEFIEIGIDVPGRIIEAEKRVLSVIPAEYMDDYLKRKTALYQTEIGLDEKEPDKYLLGDEGRHEFEQTIAFLDNNPGNVAK